jgi:hypothetical protein
MNKHFICRFLTVLPLVKAKAVAGCWVVLLGGEFSQQTNLRAGQLGFGSFQHAIVLLLVFLLLSSQMRTMIVASNVLCCWVVGSVSKQTLELYN